MRSEGRDACRWRVLRQERETFVAYDWIFLVQLNLFPTQIPLRFREFAQIIAGKSRYSLDGKSHDLTRAW